MYVHIWTRLSKGIEFLIDGIIFREKIKIHEILKEMKNKTHLFSALFLKQKVRKQMFDMYLIFAK